MFTARSVGDSWVGRANGVAIESRVAEVVWWTRADSTGKTSLHRRVLLIRPDFNTGPGGSIPWFPSTTDANAFTDMQNFLNTNDISVHLVPDPNNAGQFLLAANTLGDLTKRENRFCHLASSAPFRPSTLLGFPFLLDVSTASPMSLANVTQSGLQQGDDVILTHVQGFDIKVFDPQAQIRSDGVRALVPSDPGWAAAATHIGNGAFVDLNYSRYSAVAIATTFSGVAHNRSGINAIAPASAYDTWSFHYEHDGIDQDGVGGADQGTNGLVDNIAICYLFDVESYYFQSL
jgi:hypothetical protein